MMQYCRFLFLLAFALSSLIALSQTTSENTDHVYGHDPLLYNGRIYSFFPVVGTGGTQYLNEKADIHGAVRLRGVTYTDLSLNYDLYNQLLVLQYKNAMGSPAMIEISSAWLEMFDLDGCHFEVERITDTTTRIFQVLGKGNFKIVYYRRKELQINTQSASRNRYFTDVIREMYVKKDDRLVKYKNNRSFISVFSKPQQEEIKKYIRKQKIKVKKANDQKITDLINFCNTLSGI
jgi:hypothetical protein